MPPRPPEFDRCARSPLLDVLGSAAAHTCQKFFRKPQPCVSIPQNKVQRCASVGWIMSCSPCPPAGRPTRRNFYSGILGIPEAKKPAELAGRGGCWFEDGELKVHLGVEKNFSPARKAHPAFLVEDLAALTAALTRPAARSRMTSRWKATTGFSSTIPLATGSNCWRSRRPRHAPEATRFAGLISARLLSQRPLIDPPKTKTTEETMNIDRRQLALPVLPWDYSA